MNKAFLIIALEIHVRDVSSRTVGPFSQGELFVAVHRNLSASESHGAASSEAPSVGKVGMVEVEHPPLPEHHLLSVKHYNARPGRGVGG